MHQNLFAPKFGGLHFGGNISNEKAIDENTVSEVSLHTEHVLRKSLLRYGW